MSNPTHNTELDPGKYAPWVSLLREDSGYLRVAPAPAYWALAPHYVGQFTETGCSLASAVMVVNAARRRGAARLSDRPAPRIVKDTARPQLLLAALYFSIFSLSSCCSSQLLQALARTFSRSSAFGRFFSSR